MGRRRRATAVALRRSPARGPRIDRSAARLAVVGAAAAACLVAGAGIAAADPAAPTAPGAVESAAPTEPGAPGSAAPTSTAPTSTAPAEPEGPGEEEIRAAEQAADAVVQRLAGLADRLATASAELDAARAASAIALDGYQAEQAAFVAAQAAAEAAGVVAREAGAVLDAARTELAAFARAGYIQGSTSPGLQALLSSRNPEQLLERLTLLGHAGGQKADALVRFTMARHVADSAATEADAALGRAAVLQQGAAETLAAAEAVESDARRQAEAVEQERTALLAELAQAHQDLVTLLGDSDAAPAYERRLAGIAGALAEGELDVPLGELAGAGSSPVAAAAIQAALQAVGTPYAWGGGTLTGPGPGFGVDAGVVGFDCSGLTRYAYAQADVGVARNSRAQYASLPKVARADLRPGDLVFWATDRTDPSTIHHVALYLGGGRIVEAPHSGARVSVRSMYWTGYIGAVRPTG
ncbi:C40 family peptidase [Modestobacter lapidis]|nr:C40 family peptidase [Modestobacter lapidis]